jgi:two-component system chemotaxis response regulator CheY
MKTCLVVDDSSVVRKIARRILEGLEFQVTEAEDGSKALEICQRQLPDAVLLDWNMPVMDGFDFMKPFDKDIIADKFAEVGLLPVGQAMV